MRTLPGVGRFTHGMEVLVPQSFGRRMIAGLECPIQVVTDSVDMSSARGFAVKPCGRSYSQIASFHVRKKFPKSRQLVKGRSHRWLFTLCQRELHIQLGSGPGLSDSSWVQAKGIGSCVGTTKTYQRTKLSLETLEARRLLATVWADFNNDGFDDLAVGTPGEDSGAGLVHVLYGSAAGLTATGSQTWGQTILGTDSSEAGDNFGAALAAGDYNNDGFTDLAVGVPGEDIGAATDAGLVHFIFGSATG